MPPFALWGVQLHPDKAARWGARSEPQSGRVCCAATHHSVFVTAGACVGWAPPTNNARQNARRVGDAHPTHYHRSTKTTAVTARPPLHYRGLQLHPNETIFNAECAMTQSCRSGLRARIKPGLAQPEAAPTWE